MEKSVTDNGSNSGEQSAALKYSGFAYLMADAALFSYGLAKREYGTAMTGLGWGVGGLAAATYGKQSPEYQLKRLSQDLGQYLQEKGYYLPPTSEISRETIKSHRLMEGVERFLYDHPSEVLNGVYGALSLGLTHSGFSKGDNWQAASGLLVGAGALSGLLIKEKQVPQGQDKATLLGNPVGWIQEKPLRLSGAFYTMNNVSLAKSGWDEMRATPANKSYMLKYLAVASYVVANNLLGKSSKDRSADAAYLPIEAIEKAAAEVICAQPEKLQEALLEDVAEFLSGKNQVADSKEQISMALKAKTKELAGGASIQQATHHGRVDESRVQSI